MKTIAERLDNIFRSSNDLSSYWSSVDQISPETAHFSLGDQSAPESETTWAESVADIFRPQPSSVV